MRIFISRLQRKTLGKTSLVATQVDTLFRNIQNLMVAAEIAYVMA